VSIIYFKTPHCFCKLHLLKLCKTFKSFQRWVHFDRAGSCHLSCTYPVTHISAPSSAILTLPSKSEVFGTDMLWGKTRVQLFAQAWCRLSLSSLFRSRPCAHLHHLFPQKTPQLPRPTTLCVRGYSWFLFAFPPLRCLEQSQHGFSCPWGWRSGGHRVVSYAQTPSSCPKYGKEGAKTP